jgi:hypothetical protein
MATCPNGGWSDLELGEELAGEARRRRRDLLAWADAHGNPSVPRRQVCDR